MMIQIRVSPKVLQSKVTEYDRSSNAIQTILSNLTHLQDTLHDE